MAAPPNEYAFDLDAAERAGQLWRERRTKREKNVRLLKERKFDEVESKERLAKRANRLIDKVKKQVGENPRESAVPEGLRPYLRRGAIQPEEMTNVVVERVIGKSRDFLSIAFFEIGSMANRAVGRIVTPVGDGRVSYGTGFMVTPRLLMTNHHVLTSDTDAARSSVEFDYQIDRSGNPLPVQRFALDPRSFFLNDRELDFALVAVKESGSNRLSRLGFHKLIGVEGKAILGNALNVIQHPKGEMKQVVIRDNRLVDLLESKLHYECDTEPGSSGSPVFNDQWEVVALHHSGVPKTDATGNLLDIDGRIWRRGDDPDRIAWVANEGIRISKIVSFIRSARVREHERRLRDELIAMAEGTRPEETDMPTPHFRDDEPARVIERPNPAVEAPAAPAAGSVTMTIPLHVTVSLGGGTAGMAGQAAVASGTSEDLLEKVQPDPNYDERPGYVIDFTGFDAPLPRLTEAIAGDALVVDEGADNPYELKYYHASIIMNAKRKLAFVAAVNYNAAADFIHDRDDKDAWYADPRAKNAQTGEDLYKANPLDRGHLNRRADAAWGDTEEEAKLANDDTFHFTNCSPQHEIFNQSGLATKKKLRLWGNLENHVAAQAKKDNRKVSVFNGPVFRSNDRKYRGVAIPREFWKVIVFERDSGEPGAAAFILSQASQIKNLPKEEFEPGEFSVFQVSLEQLEEKTKLDFGQMRDWDTFSAEEAFETTGGAVVEITSMNRISL